MYHTEMEHECTEGLRWSNFLGKYICDALRDLVPFVQFKKREKHPMTSMTFSKVVGLWRSATLRKAAGFSLQFY